MQAPDQHTISWNAVLLIASIGGVLGGIIAGLVAAAIIGRRS